MVLSKEQILQVQDLRTEDVDVPEWGGTVRVRMMTGAERDAFERSLFVEKDGKMTQDLTNFRAKLCACTIVDHNGERQFSAPDIAALGGKSAAALSRIADVAQRLNGIGERERQAAVQD